MSRFFGLFAFMLCVCACSSPIQKGCDNDRDCSGVCIENLPGGLCTLECTETADCPGGAVCADTEVVNGICLYECSNTQDCVDQVGDGYVCDTETELHTDASVQVCID